MSENTTIAVLVVAMFVGVPLAIAACIYAAGSGERACVQAHCSFNMHSECECK